MVRLVVVQSDVERASDDEVLRVNPRPRLRGDCEPLACPHCGKPVAMRLGEDAGQLTITCPSCTGRVWADQFTDEWLPRDDFPDDVELAPVPPRMLNHCRPCPFVGCVHNLFLDVMDSGMSIRMNFPSKEPGDLDESCSLDVAERDGATLDEVGKTINITRERVRQLIEQAFKTARKNTNTALFKAAIDVEDVGSLSQPHHALEEAG